MRVGHLQTVDNSDEQAPAVEFEDFWCLCYRKEAKKDARKAWNELEPDQQLTAVVSMSKWRSIWPRQGRETHNVKLPATWLRGECYEDEIPREFAGRHASHMPAKSTPLPPRGEMPQEIRELIAKIKAGRS